MKFINEGMPLKDEKGAVLKDKDGKVLINKVNVTVPGLHIRDLKFGETVDIAEGYAWPERATNGARLPAIIEKLAPALKPADPKERELWLKVPPAGRADGMREHPVLGVEVLVKQGYPQGVAEAINRKAVAARDEERRQRRAQLEQL